MAILITIIVGFIVGLIARFLVPGGQGMGFILTTVLGVSGSLLASFAGPSLGLYSPGQAAGWIGSIVGAIVVLLVVGLIRGRRL